MPGLPGVVHWEQKRCGGRVDKNGRSAAETFMDVRRSLELNDGVGR